MLTQVDVISERTSVEDLTLTLGSTSDPIQIKDISGLDPVKAAVTSSQYGAQDAEIFTGASVGKRNIVLKLGLNPDWAVQTMEGLRQLLYVYFMPKLNVTLKFTSTHLPDCAISGVVEDMAPNMFSADPEILISILCVNPDFVATEETIVEGLVKLTYDEEMVVYEGTKPTGFTLKVEYSEDNESYTGLVIIRNDWVDSQLFWITETTIDESFYLEFSSIPGSKYVRKVATDDPEDYTNLLGLVDPNYLEWATLKTGDNRFAVLAEEIDQAWTMTYSARFGGL